MECCSTLWILVLAVLKIKPRAAHMTVPLPLISSFNPILFFLIMVSISKKFKKMVTRK